MIVIDLKYIERLFVPLFCWDVQNFILCNLDCYVMMIIEVQNGLCLY